ncbi:hypothetical protein BDZ89DRAFT_1076462 [Hymenopellis radicata]|nr:hypothetical protein BDZ89DRAFT_1076462 [Hymenopellis radicata]
MSISTSATMTIGTLFGVIPLYFARLYLLLFLLEAVSFHVVLALLLTYRRPDDSEVKDHPDPRAEDMGRDKEIAGRVVLVDCVLWFLGIPLTISSHPAMIIMCLAGAITVIYSGPGWLNLPGWKGTRYPVREGLKEE